MLSSWSLETCFFPSFVLTYVLYFAYSVSCTFGFLVLVSSCIGETTSGLVLALICHSRSPLGLFVHLVSHYRYMKWLVSYILCLLPLILIIVIKLLSSASYAGFRFAYSGVIEGAIMARFWTVTYFVWILYFIPFKDLMSLSLFCYYCFLM